MELSFNETIKALECCASGKCTGDECPIHQSKDACLTVLSMNALEAVNTLQSINADLNESLRLAAEANKDIIAKSGAYKTLYEKLKTKYNLCARRFYEEGVKSFAEKLEESIAFKCLDGKSEEYTDGYHDALEWVDKVIDYIKEEMFEGDG